MEMVCNITHGLFLQYQVRTHSYEQVYFLTFVNQYQLLEQPEEMRDRYRTDLKRSIHLMEMMQPLVRSKYRKPLIGMECCFAENAIDAQVIRGQANELYKQLLRVSTIIIKTTGVLLPMYDKALFSDVAYAAIMKALENIAAMRFLQLTRLKTWHCTFHFASTRWIK